MALDHPPRPYRLTSSPGHLPSISNSNLHAGTYSWVLTLSYQTLLGGLLATDTFTLDVHFTAMVIPPAPVVLTPIQIAELEKNLQVYEANLGNLTGKNK